MRDNKFRMELRELVNRHGIDTELDAPDFLIAEYIESFLVIIKQLSTHAGYTPLNNMVGTNLQPTTTQGTALETPPVA
jgi:hypothetical protein